MREIMMRQLVFRSASSLESVENWELLFEMKEHLTLLLLLLGWPENSTMWKQPSGILKNSWDETGWRSKIWDTNN